MISVDASSRWLSLLANSKRLLVLGADAADGAFADGNQSAREIVGVVASGESPSKAWGRLGQIVVVPRIDSTSLPGSPPFDGILCSRWLEHVTDPLEFLSRIRSWLAPGGVLIAGFTNLRHHTHLSALFEGQWRREAEKPMPLQFFTRREIEKLFDRAGFALDELEPEDSADTSCSPKDGPVDCYRFGRFQASGLTPDEVAEFGVRRYRAIGRPIEFGAFGNALRSSFVGDRLDQCVAPCEKPLAIPASGSSDAFSRSTPAREPLLSLCMIVRNSARTLEACLESIRPWVDEMIVVDTGSTDETPAIVERMGASLFHFPWPDSFSIARNESLRHARGKWLFWMDSDDTIDEANGRRLRELAARQCSPTTLGYVMQVHCPGKNGLASEDVTVVDHVKMFRNLPELRFDGRIHEQILPAIRLANGDCEWTDVFVVHSGSDHSPEGQFKKWERDLRLLHLELKERPQHPFTLFNLGMTYLDQNEYLQAREFLQSSIAHSNPGESHLRKAYALLVHAQIRLRLSDAAWQTCVKALELFPDDAELRFRKAMLLHEQGKLAESAETYCALLHNGGMRRFRSIDIGILGFKARQNLAIVYEEMAAFDLAEEQWQEIVRERPRYRTGWRGLGSLLLRQAKSAEVSAMAERLAGDPDLHVEGVLLRVKSQPSHQVSTDDQGRLRQAVAESPDDLELRRTLCRVLFENGDLAAARISLEELIARDPQDAAAHFNLGTVYLRIGDDAASVEAYRQAIRHRSDHALSFLHLGYALERQGKLSEAHDAWRQTLRLEPGNPEATARLQQSQMKFAGGATARLTEVCRS